jgi:hypothetical protein
MVPPREGLEQKMLSLSVAPLYSPGQYRYLPSRWWCERGHDTLVINLTAAAVAAGSRNMSKAKLQLIIPVISVLFSVSCTTPTITFLSNEKANVSLVEFDEAGGNGDLLGETPVSIQADQIKNQFIKIWGDGLESQYWIVKPLEQEKNEITLRLDRREEDEGEGAVTQRMNRYFRMLLRSYQALTAKEWETARELAKQLSREVPEAAAPFVITGLSYLSEGKKSNARTAFLQAKNLDPEDLDIDALLRLSKP